MQYDHKNIFMRDCFQHARSLIQIYHFFLIVKVSVYQADVHSCLLNQHFQFYRGQFNPFEKCSLL
jgi:hypothetical protein